MRSKPAAPDSSTVLGKIMLVLHAYSQDDAVLGFAELLRRTGLSKGTLHRLLADLTGARLIDRTEDGYRLGAHLFELGMRASVERSLIEVATPFMEDLYVRTAETVHLGVLDGTEVVYLSKIGGHRQAAAPSRIGGRMPLHCTAIGKTLLAFGGIDSQDKILRAPLVRRTQHTIVTPSRLRSALDRIVADGVAYEFEESAVGIVCVGAPIWEGDVTVAAISVTGPSHRFRPQQHVTHVLAAAQNIGNALARRDEMRA
ncbi:IclR family transcriptional regulator [Gordonia bronchialis]|uniref:IclR family transcriptional regulator n=1 Tax=Gordonia bronchialis TaxID=2054 RepID=UPI00226E5CB4|nr:IclR family transcriptional regulator [Gordonia bronchialis]